jgi:MSHA biogenesis protein MshQ
VNSNQVSAVVSPIVLRNVASVNNGGGSTSLTISKPADVVTNDVMLAQITVRGGTGVTITAPSGWAQIRRENSGTTLAQAIYWKLAGASEPASYAWTFSATQKASGGIAAYSGVSTSTPINAHGGQANASSTSVTAPSITPTAAGARLVGFFGTATGTTFTSPGSMTERWDTASTGGSAGTRTTSEGADQTLGVTGATGTRVATAGATAVNIGQLVALTPQ